MLKAGRHSAPHPIKDLALDELREIHPGSRLYVLADNIHVQPLATCL